jgi:hypothetical protein
MLPDLRAAPLRAGRKRKLSLEKKWGFGRKSPAGVRG